MRIHVQNDKHQDLAVNCTAGNRCRDLQTPQPLRLIPFERRYGRVYTCRIGDTSYGKVVVVLVVLGVWGIHSPNPDAYTTTHTTTHITPLLLTVMIPMT